MRGVLLCLVLLVSGYALASDPRNITNGNVVTSATGGYFDQPQIVICPDGTWVVVMTANQQGTEGQAGEHLSSSRSSDNGTTWSPLLNIEPPSSIDASYASTFITPKGRIYTIYTYNADNITKLPNGQPISRTDELGHFKLKYSDDCAQSWSEERYEVPFPETSIDYHNNWNGTVKMFWMVAKPLIVETAVYLPFTKIGAYVQGPPCQVYFLRSNNILNATDLSEITWDMLPRADVGVEAPSGDISEEPHLVVLDSPDNLWVTYRTATGYLGGGVTTNGGQNWTSRWVTYSGGEFGRPLKNPRAPITPAKFSNGNYLLLFFNNNPVNPFTGRNPYWLTGGRFVNGSIPSIEWSQPEIVLYSTGSLGDAGYPDFVELDENYYITETQKGGPIAYIRVSQIPPQIVQFLWNQWEISEITPGTVLDMVAPASGTKVQTPLLPDLSTGGGFSFLMWLSISPNFTKNATIIDTRGSPEDAGVWISTGGETNPSLGIYISDGKYSASLYTDSSCGSVLLDTQFHHIGFVVDGGPKMITITIDAILCDGSDVAPQGWAFFDMGMTSVRGSGWLVVESGWEGVKVEEVRVYERFLFTSEVIGNWRAGIQ